MLWSLDRTVFKDSDFLPADNLNSTQDVNANVAPSGDANTNASSRPTEDATSGPPIANQYNIQLVAISSVAVEPEIVTKNTLKLNVSIEAISPIPKPKEKVSKRGKLKTIQRATVLTSSPYKNDLHIAKELQMAQAKVKELKMKISKAKSNNLKLEKSKIKKEKITKKKKSPLSVRRNLEDDLNQPSTSTQIDICIEE